MPFNEQNPLSQVLATVSADGGERIADVSRLVDALKIVVAKAGQALTFKVTASCWVSLVGHEGKLQAPPVSVTEVKDGVELGPVSVADLKERLRKRLIAQGLLQEGEPLDDHDDEFNETEIAGVDKPTEASGGAEAVPGGAQGAPDEGNTAGLVSMGASLMARTTDALDAAKGQASALADAAKQQANTVEEQAHALADKTQEQATGLATTDVFDVLGAAKETANTLADKAKEQAAGLAKKASKFKSYLAEAEARLMLDLRAKQAEADAAIVEQARSCAAALFAFNVALFTLARQLRAPVVGDDYSFAAAAKHLRATLDAEAERQTGAKVVIERRMDVKRVTSGESPLTLAINGWDGTTQAGKPPVGAGAAEAFALLFGPDGLQQVQLPELAQATALAMGSTSSALASLTSLALACLPGSDLKMGLPTPKIVRLMLQDAVTAGMSGPDARAKVAESVFRVPTAISSNIKHASAVAPWVGSTFSTTLRVFCVELRAALRSEDEAPDDDDVTDDVDGDDGLAASFSAGSELTRAADKVPDKVDPGNLTA